MIRRGLGSFKKEEDKKGKKKKKEGKKKKKWVFPETPLRRWNNVKKKKHSTRVFFALYLKLYKHVFVILYIQYATK